MSASAFAAARGLSVNTLRWWRWKLKQAGYRLGRGAKEGRLLEVRIADLEAVNWVAQGEEGGQDRSVYLTLPGGVELELPEAPAPRWLAALCEALRDKTPEART